MRIECIAIGTELLTTERLDTNSVWLAQRLSRLGLAFTRKTCTGDDPAELRELFREALGRSDLILCTGGLGPTFDDLTKECWSEVLGDTLVEHAEAKATLEAFFQRRGRTPSPSNYKQVMLPERAEMLPNAHGTAPGILWKNPEGHPGRTVVLMPGVPREMKGIWEAVIEPRLAALATTPVHTLRLVTCRIPESTLDDRTRALREVHGALDWTILSSHTHVELQARGTRQRDLDAAEADFRSVLGEDLVCVGEGSVESTVLERLKARGETFAVAESMTGGLLAARFTAQPGASAVFSGGVLVYSPEAKITLAGVDPLLLSAHGTVSEAASRALAEGIRLKLGTPWGVAITGNAGPGADPNGSAEVGAVHLAVAGPHGTAAFSYSFPGARGDIQLRAASWALDLLRRQLA